ncbi:hypothetical protein BJ742DRAFT_680028, partial [Cladochytrium replicatum]
MPDQHSSDGAEGQPLTSSSSSKFELTPTQFNELVDPKSPEKLQALGGIAAVLSKLHVDAAKGLTTVNAAGQQPIDLSARQDTYGINELPQPKEKSLLEFMWNAMKDKILIILSVAAVFEIGIGIYKTFSAGEAGEAAEAAGWIDGLAIVLAIIIVVMVGSVNDYRKQAQFRKLNNFGRSLVTVKVIRDGQQVVIPAKDLVVGDVCIVEAGDVLPADGIFLDGFNVQCDESSQTGEPMSINKSHEKDPFFLSGTKVTNGVGRMITIAIGPNSMSGRSLLALEVEPDDTPLQEKLSRLADLIAKVGGAAAVIMVVLLIILYFIFRDPSWTVVDIVKDMLDVIISGVTLIVVAVPEGLPLAVTLSLAYATIRMLKDQNLVRHLMACETMGNATTICSDKTGTLTLNRMTVVAGVVSEVEFELDDIPSTFLNQAVTGRPQPDLHNKILELISTSLNMNSTATETTKADGSREFSGSKTEIALLQFTEKIGFPYSVSRESNKVVEIVPFSSQRKRMSTFVKTGDRTSVFESMGLPVGKDTEFILFTKGASEIILGGATRYVNSDGKVVPLDKARRAQFEESINSFASQALRTIAFGFRPVGASEITSQNADSDSEASTANGEDNRDVTDIILFGIVGIQDPLRPEVPGAVKQCQKAGVRVRMVTGDNLATARAIARGCGILTRDGVVMEGPQFRQLSPEEMDEILPRLQVLARSSPNDKQILVNALRRIGETVAVTGDGTNDAPALKAADVGFSMGIAGTEVAKEASDIVLMDDNFASLVKAVMWGRSVYDSVRKFLQFQLTVNVSAVVITLFTSVYSTVVYKLPVPALTAIQLLWVNLIMDTFAALALATDPPTPALLNRRPSSRSESLISFDMWRMIIGQGIYQIVACLFLYLAGPSLWPAKATGHQGGDEGLDLHTAAMVFNTFVMMQAFNEINARSITRDFNVFAGIHRNFIFIGIWVGTFVMQVVLIQFLGFVFKTDPAGLDGVDWAICIAFGAGSLLVGVLIRLLPDW